MGETRFLKTLAFSEFESWSPPMPQKCLEGYIHRYLAKNSEFPAGGKAREEPDLFLKPVNIGCHCCLVFATHSAYQ